MGRSYGGNLSAFKAAAGRIFKLDLVVTCDEWYEAHIRLECIRLRIEDRDGRLIDSTICSHHDEDVLYSTCTNWLNRMYDQLKDWK